MCTKSENQITGLIYDYIQKFPDWTPWARTANVQLYATGCSCITTLWVSPVSFAAMTLCVASQRVFIVVSVYFVIDSVRKLLVTPSYLRINWQNWWFGMCWITLLYDSVILYQRIGIQFDLSFIDTAFCLFVKKNGDKLSERKIDILLLLNLDKMPLTFTECYIGGNRF
jgi:hypothetical protein